MMEGGGRGDKRKKIRKGEEKKMIIRDIENNKRWT